MTEAELCDLLCRQSALERASAWQKAGRDARVDSPNIEIKNLHLHEDSAWNDTGMTGSVTSGCGT